MAAEDYIPDYCDDHDQPGGVIYFLDDYELIRQTEKAVLVRAGEVEAWLPKSQCRLARPPFKGMTDSSVILSCEGWLAQQKNLPWRTYQWDG